MNNPDWKLAFIDYPKFEKEWIHPLLKKYPNYTNTEQKMIDHWVALSHLPQNLNQIKKCQAELLEILLDAEILQRYYFFNSHNKTTTVTSNDHSVHRIRQAVNKLQQQLQVPLNNKMDLNQDLATFLNHWPTTLVRNAQNQPIKIKQFNNINTNLMTTVNIPLVSITKSPIELHHLSKYGFITYYGKLNNNLFKLHQIYKHQPQTIKNHQKKYKKQFKWFRLWVQYYAEFEKIQNQIIHYYTQHVIGITDSLFCFDLVRYNQQLTNKQITTINKKIRPIK